MTKHFDNLAEKYDNYKDNSWYYCDALMRILQNEVSNRESVLDVGCGTGDIIVGLQPKKGIGIDTSKEMIRLAKNKYDMCTIRFVHSSAVSLAKEQERFNTVICVDVIEHMTDVKRDIEAMTKLLKNDGKLIILMANPHWEPILMLLEKLGMKMPEGEHYRMPYKDIKKIMLDAGLTIVTSSHSWYLPFPLYIPFFSNVFNRIVENTPLLNRLGLIEKIVAEKNG